MIITQAESQLIRLLVETSNLQGEEADDAWGFLERIQQHKWSDEMSKAEELAQTLSSNWSTTYRGDTVRLLRKQEAVIKQQQTALAEGIWYINQLEMIVYCREDTSEHGNVTAMKAAIAAAKEVLK